MRQGGGGGRGGWCGRRLCARNLQASEHHIPSCCLVVVTWLREPTCSQSPVTPMLCGGRGVVLPPPPPHPPGFPAPYPLLYPSAALHLHPAPCSLPPAPCSTRQLPSTCTYADYVATVPKPCRLAFGGNPAFALLQSSTSVTVDVHRCSGSTPDALPSIGVALGGDATVSTWSLGTETQLHSPTSARLRCLHRASWCV
jgi:hypothetical protein